MFVIGAIGFIYWEWKAKSPLMNIKLFKFRNFAICCFLMSLVGGVLNASTVLQPQFLQSLLGYTATNAGKALTAGGIALVGVMPLAGILTGKFSARNLAAVGFVFFEDCSFYYAAKHTTLQMSFGFASFLRVLQMLPIPFCFISITNAAYVGLPREASNQVSGIDQLYAQRGWQHHDRDYGCDGDESRAVPPGAAAELHADGKSDLCRAMCRAITAALNASGRGAQGAVSAQASIYQQLQQQAGALSYSDIYMALCWMSCGR